MLHGSGLQGNQRRVQALSRRINLPGAWMMHSVPYRSVPYRWSCNNSHVPAFLFLFLFTSYLWNPLYKTQTFSFLHQNTTLLEAFERFTPDLYGLLYCVIIMNFLPPRMGLPMSWLYLLLELLSARLTSAQTTTDDIPDSFIGFTFTGVGTCTHLSSSIAAL